MAVKLYGTAKCPLDADPAAFAAPHLGLMTVESCLHNRSAVWCLPPERWLQIIIQCVSLK